jgi:hypothetical protein
MLEKLTIRRCEIARGGKQVVPQPGPTDSFAALINPSEVKHGHSISYSQDEAIGDVDSEQVFGRYAPETVSFSLVLDGTGALPNPRGGAAEPVRPQIDRLKKICYDYNSETHAPNVVKLTWGNTFQNFYARLQQLGIDYTMFKPTGEPLRAKLQLSFVRFRSTTESQLAAGRQSADLSRVVRVREGDTLPLLCAQYYGDANRYLEVARVNDLVNFRELAPNTLLRFPPLA